MTDIPTIGFLMVLFPLVAAIVIFSLFWKPCKHEYNTDDVFDMDVNPRCIKCNRKMR